MSDSRLRTIARHWADALFTPVPFAHLHLWPRFLSDWRAFKAMPGGEGLRWCDAYPRLSDATAKTPFDPHYFHQGAWLARRLAATRPERHVDVGSKADMVSVLSGFVPVTFVDIRPLATTLSNLSCLAASITELPFEDLSVKSLSCLHVIEHVGLGRYGDALDPTGSVRAARELARVLSPGGRLYLSTPVGRERICFNAHRIFAPQTVMALFPTLSHADFAWVDDRGELHRSAKPQDADGADYACGLFEFVRMH